MSEEITKEEFVAWKENKVTKFVMDALRDREEGKAVLVLNGGTLGLVGSGSTDFAVGYVQGLREVRRVQYD